ncbi:MAG: TonB-dependent receptor [Adhaeribacter sp.]|nr:TonB-dependent receptor [Adhaeribacter sp.]
MKNFFLLFVFFCSLGFSAAAQRQIRGRVLDSQLRQPLVGASVGAMGTGTITDERGRFAFMVPAETDSLIISMIGYQMQSVKLPQTEREFTILLQTTNTILTEVKVTGYETNRPLLETAGSIGVLQARDINRFNTTSLVPALNLIPGVRMEERATASYRLSIRGSSLRAPFGVRNVKLYLNEIPLVEANGTIPLNLLDASTIGRIEVIKGPAGSTYGAGTGGTILLETLRAPAGETSAEVGAMVGSYGLRRYNTTVATASEKASFLVRYTKQQLEGYRQQSAMDRDVLLIAGQLYPSDKQTFSFHGYYSDLYYELPGALNREQYQANSRQARQLNVDQNASLNLNGVNIGLAHRYDFSPQVSNSTSIFGVFSFLNHPFTNDYERNTNQAYGGRTKTTYKTVIGGVGTRFMLGAEWQRSFVNSRHYENIKGVSGKLNFDDEVTLEQGFVFAQTEADLPQNFIFTLGASLNDMQYGLTRVMGPGQTASVANRREFDPQFSPRVGLVKMFSPQVSAHGSISAGFSPPTDAEIRPSDASFNTSLNPERGVNYELGLRGNLFNEKLTFDVTGFQFRLNETIVSRATATGVVVFNNAGATDQKGVEAALAYYILQAPTQPLSLLKAWSTYAYSHFVFRDYQRDDQDYSGNKLTGTPPHVWTAGLDAESRLGFYLNITGNYTSRIPLNDANTVYASDFILLGARGGFKQTFGQRWQTEIYAGIDNALDVTYSLGNDLNGFGNRYFQAAPGRNYFTGLQLKYLFSAR